MIYHSIHKLIAAGIDDILIVTGRDHMGDVVNLLGSGHEFGASFSYKVQDQAGGIAQALGWRRASLRMSRCSLFWEIMSSR